MKSTIRDSDAETRLQSIARQIDNLRGKQHLHLQSCKQPYECRACRSLRKQINKLTYEYNSILSEEGTRGTE